VGTSERIYRGSVRTLSLVFIVLGVAILLSTLVNGGAPLSLGVFLGLAFIAVGGGRLWLAARGRGAS
jgi:hypothetical protein